MVNLKKKTISGNEYYYLVHNYRYEGKVLSIEKEIGRNLPENFEEIKESFITTIATKRWIKKIDELKKRYDKKVDFLPNFVQAEHLKDFGIRFTHNTNKIEGSTLTLREVYLAINEPGIPINRPTDDIVEAKLHMQCYEEMISNIEKTKVSMELILRWHRILFNMHPNRLNFAGIVRRGQIFISGSNYIPPSGGIECEMLLEKLFNWYAENENTLHPVLLACLMHFRFVSIHPFDDGNGRISRLLMNYILFKKKFPMFDIPVTIRKSYYNALERANLKEDEMIFVGWFFKNYLKSIKDLRIPG
ncbi:MAG: Fic family protein [Promethearchaeota archaeon]|nr:MAG: Fic family protein [Candidatus Lokiarchaeota archaeon]